MVEEVAPDGTLLIAAGTGNHGTPTPGPATDSALGAPVGVALDTAGNLYIADRTGHVVEKVTPNGALSIVVGTGTNGYPKPGPATSSNLGYPSGVAVDPSGTVYIADSASRVVERVTSGGALSIFAGTGGPGGITPRPGPATNRSLELPVGVATDAAGNVCIADGGFYGIEEVTPAAPCRSPPTTAAPARHAPGWPRPAAWVASAA